VKITPIEIRKYEFNKTFRGYDTEEVRYFLEMLADELESLNREKLELETELEQSKSRLQEYKQIEKSMQDALIVAKETSDKSLANSRKEAKLIIADAQAKADRIIEEAHEEASQIRQDISQLRIKRDSLLVKIKNILTSELELLEAMEEADDNGEDIELEEREEPLFDIEDFEKEMASLDRDLFDDVESGPEDEVADEDYADEEEEIDFTVDDDTEESR